MRQQPFEQEQGHQFLKQVYRGMEVYDPNGRKIGVVECAYLGTLEDETDACGVELAAISSPKRRESSLIEDFAKAISPGDQLPEPLRQRLRRQGFMRIDSKGLFAADRYVTPDHIASVSYDRVILRVPREVLPKP